MAAAGHTGRGDKDRVDQAAVDTMRPALGSIPIDGIASKSNVMKLVG